MKSNFLLTSLSFLMLGCQPPGPLAKNEAMPNPSPDSLRIFLQTYIKEVWGKHDFELAKNKYWHPDVYNANTPDIPHGQTGMMDQVNAFLTGFPNASIEYDDAVVEGNIIAARIWLKGTHTGEFMGVKPTGKHIRIREYVFLEMKDGKLWKFHPLVDFTSLMEQIQSN